MSRPKTDVRTRFERQYIPEPNTGCWLWTGFLYPNGYGNFNAVRGRGGYAHRTSYELYKGTIPPGMHIDHLCRVKCCVNPDHLEIVTPTENQRRSPISNASRKFCRNGHEYTDESTYVYSPGGKFRCRRCRTCDYDRWVLKCQS